MALINTNIMQELKKKRVEVFFVSGQATKWWNSQRKDKQTEICLLGGYYWSMGQKESGPFRTPSAAWRDCYYRELLKLTPPGLTKEDVEQRNAELAAEQLAQASRRKSKKQQRNPVQDGIVRPER